MNIYDPTFLLVLCGVSLFGFVAGIIGTFALLTRQSLLADTISHAALPGIGIAFLLTHTTHAAMLLSGGIVTGLIGACLALTICWTTPLKQDAALGFVLSAFFGLGMVLLTIIQKKPIAQQGILNKFLFGSAATLLPTDVWFIVGGASIVLTCLFFFWKPLVLVSFDHTFASSLHMRVRGWQLMITCLLVIMIVLGLQTVGVVLMSTMCIAPAAAIKQWSDRCETVALMAGFLGAGCAVIATVLSSWADHLPTGPTLVVLLTIIVLFSLVCAPRKGIAWAYIMRIYAKKVIS